MAATFHLVEIDLLRSLVGQLVELIHDDHPAATSETTNDPLAAALSLGDEPERPSDPVLLRLFPDAYEESDEAREFRRYTERRLRDSKLNAAASVLASLAAAAPEGEKASLRLERDEAQAWLRTLTDLRLALGTRLGVSEDDDNRWELLPEDDPSRYVHDVYDWLGWVQETLVRALTPE